MSKSLKHQQSFWDFGPQQIIAGLCTGFAVSPFNTIVDKAIIENTNGKTPLWKGVAQGLKNMLLKPKLFFTAFEFKWVLAVYQVTYVASNLADHYVVPWLDPAISKLMTVFLVNTSICLFKDKALAQGLGHGQARKFPISALGVFFTRDIIAMASAFTVPPILAEFIQKKWGFSQSTSMRISQLTCPVMIQFVGTPIHLLGLDLYNRTGATILERLIHLRKIYFHSVALLMLRFLPAYGIGGVFNIQFRKYLLQKKH